MKRRTALAAMMAVVGQVITNAQEWSSTGNLAKFPRSEELTVALGGEDGYKRFSFTLSGEKITISAEELFAALKA